MLNNIDAGRRGYGLLVLRLVIGAIFLGHGYLKFVTVGVGETAGFYASLGAPAPGISAWIGAIIQTLGGIALILGILTLPAGLVLALFLAIAIPFARMGNGFFAPGGAELDLTLLAASLAIAIAGPGAFSLSEMIRGNNSSRQRSG